MAPLRLILLASLLVQLCASESLYEVLGVSNTATKAEIKKGYVRLAKKWHPDKNRDPEAVGMMEKINKAYQILSDDKKRKRYDLLGEESDGPHQGTTSFSSGTFTFRFKTNLFDDTSLPDVINSQYFMESLLPDSHRRPYLVYYFHDFCPRCHSLTSKWAEFHKYFSEFGIGTGSVQVIINTQARVYSKIYTNEVPVVGLVLKGEVHRFKRELSIDSLKSFVNEHLPSNIDEVSSIPFLSSNETRIESNKVVVVLVSSPLAPSLKYKLIAFSLKKYSDFVFVSLSAASPQLLDYFDIKGSTKGLFIYKEPEEPAVAIRSSDITSEIVKKTIEENKMLYLPRISSPSHFDTLCPFGTNIRTCLILMVEGISDYTDSLTISYRQLAMKWKDRDFTLAYMDMYHQSDLNKFDLSSTERKSCDNGHKSRSVLFLRRSNNRKAQYTWYHGYCGTSNDETDLIKLTASREDIYDKIIFIDQPLNDESITLWDHAHEYLYKYWEKITAFLTLPLPLLFLSCYFFIFSNPIRQQEEGQGQRRPQQGQIDDLRTQQERRNRHVLESHLGRSSLHCRHQQQQHHSQEEEDNGRNQTIQQNEEHQQNETVQQNEDQQNGTAQQKEDHQQNRAVQDHQHKQKKLQKHEDQQKKHSKQSQVQQQDTNGSH